MGQQVLNLFRPVEDDVHFRVLRRPVELAAICRHSAQ
jgi:hypothetical protein